MSRRRYISTEISTDKRIRRLSDSAALFYTWMIPHAEENATITSDPDELASIVVPNRPTWTVKKVQQALADIEGEGLFVSVNGTIYFPPRSFYRYQSNVHAERRRSEQPLQNTDNSAEQRETAHNSASSSPSSSPSSSNHLAEQGSAIETFGDKSRRVFDYWCERLNHPKAEFSPERRRKIEARLRAGATVDRLCEAIDGCANSPHHMGENPQGNVYDSIDLIFRNQSKMEEFANKSTFRPGRKGPDPRARVQRIANARAQREAGLDDDLVRSFVADDDEWNEVIK